MFQVFNSQLTVKMSNANLQFTAQIENDKKQSTNLTAGTIHNLDEERAVG